MLSYNNGNKTKFNLHYLFFHYLPPPRLVAAKDHIPNLPFRTIAFSAQYITRFSNSNGGNKSETQSTALFVVLLRSFSPPRPYADRGLQLLQVNLHDISLLFLHPNDWNTTKVFLQCKVYLLLYCTYFHHRSRSRSRCSLYREDRCQANDWLPGCRCSDYHHRDGYLLRLILELPKTGMIGAQDRTANLRFRVKCFSFIIYHSFFNSKTRNRTQTQSKAFCITLLCLLSPLRPYVNPRFRFLSAFYSLICKLFAYSNDENRKRLQSAAYIYLYPARCHYRDREGCAYEGS